VVVGGSKTTDEEMLKSAREVVYDEKIAYLENVRHINIKINIKELNNCAISFVLPSFYAIFLRIHL